MVKRTKPPVNVASNEQLATTTVSPVAVLDETWSYTINGERVTYQQYKEHTAEHQRYIEALLQQQETELIAMQTEQPRKTRKKR